ncbi:hypothetical protein [Marinobacter nauticus]|uniref:hypothetical protein n=1 Tax=Marinobacter nauticus TaxID=2743 RepID=UPI001CFD23E7|nr:hypothetical protein [Marinobacter nauticus]
MRAIYVAFLFAIALSSGCTPGPESLVFQPEPGDVRYFNVNESVMIQARGGFPGTERYYHLSSIVKAEATPGDKDSSEVRSNSLSSTFAKDGRVLFTKQEPPAFSESLAAMNDLLHSGIIEHIDWSGQVRDATFNNTQALAALDGKALESALIRRSLSVIAAYQPRLPDQPSQVGMSWRAEPLVSGGLSLPALRYEVSHQTADTVTLKFRMDERDEGPSDELSPQNGHELKAIKFEGFVELERESGWPRRAHVLAHRELDDSGGKVILSQNYTLEQSGIRPGSNRDMVHLNASSALYHDRTRISDPWFRFEYVPPFGEKTVEESFDLMKRTLLWFGTEAKQGPVGLDFQQQVSKFSSVLFHYPASVRLLDAQGSPVTYVAVVNPTFWRRSWYLNDEETKPSTIPFISEEFSTEQLNSIASVEIDLPVTVPDELYTVTLAPTDKLVEIENSGLTITVDEWSSGRVLLRVSRAEGFLPDALPPISAMPVTQSGEPLPIFYTRKSHSLFEPIRKPLAEQFADRELMWKQSEFAAAVVQHVESLPIAERYGDLIYDLKAPEGEAIKAVEVNLYSTRDETRTFSAPNAQPTLKGGEVTRERFLTYSDFWDYDFAVADLNVASAGSAQAKEPAIEMYIVQPGTEGELVRIDPNTVEVSEQLYRELDAWRAEHQLPGLPIVAYTADGLALKPLSSGVFGAADPTGKPDNRRLRFWGEVAEVHYPVLVGKQ